MKRVIGLSERVNFRTNKINSKQYRARIDTGATCSSIDVVLASKLKVGPIVGSLNVKNVHGKKKRPYVFLRVILKGKSIRGKFTLIDRSHMKYRILIGQNVLKKGNFLIDPIK
jgi:hypothetical protein